MRNNTYLYSKFCLSSLLGISGYPPLIIMVYFPCFPAPMTSSKQRNKHTSYTCSEAVNCLHLHHQMSVLTIFIALVLYINWIVKGNRFQKNGDLACQTGLSILKPLVVNNIFIIQALKYYAFRLIFFISIIVLRHLNRQGIEPWQVWMEESLKWKIK